MNQLSFEIVTQHQRIAQYFYYPSHVHRGATHVDDVVVVDIVVDVVGVVAPSLHNTAHCTVL